MTDKIDLKPVRQRLREGLSKQGLSYREVAARAGIGASYISGILNEGKDPQLSYLIRVCKAANLSLSWVLYGFEISTETEKLLQIIEDNPEKRDSIISLLSQRQ